jgi:hypothetical protein
MPLRARNGLPNASRQVSPTPLPQVATTIFPAPWAAEGHALATPAPAANAATMRRVILTSAI